MTLNMTPMRARSWLVGFVLIGLFAVASVPAQAAVTPLSIDDPAGDQLDARASMDIVNVTYDVRQMNKTGPPSLVVIMTLSGPPEAQLASYRANANAGDSCRIDFTYQPGTVFAQVAGSGAGNIFMGCDGDTELVEAKTLIKDNVITMSLALDSMPKPLRAVGELKDLYSFSQNAEPLTGLIGNGDLDVINTPVPSDSAETDKTFKFA